mmetsp:Transcript_50563/g.90978  ORF Transcript_50563/g.90978 Transcript_50563/m.90978 type:complete len:208 (-) Transcript_50563:573-1196(-)
MVMREEKEATVCQHEVSHIILNSLDLCQACQLKELGCRRFARALRILRGASFLSVAVVLHHQLELPENLLLAAELVQHHALAPLLGQLGEHVFLVAPDHHRGLQQGAQFPAHAGSAPTLGILLTARIKCRLLLTVAGTEQVVLRQQPRQQAVERGEELRRLSKGRSASEERATACLLQKRAEGCEALCLRVLHVVRLIADHQAILLA